MESIVDYNLSNPATLVLLISLQISLSIYLLTLKLRLPERSIVKSGTPFRAEKMCTYHILRYNFVFVANSIETH